MAKYVNFFENLKEAQFRLLRSYVLYDGEPYYVMAITNHMADGIFRVYLQPLDNDPKNPAKFPEGMDNYNPELHQAQLGAYLDQWLTANKDSRILRKQMNSPHFNKFRPFPLGMCNYGSRTYYLERTPVRNHYQGLTRSGVVEVQLTCQPGKQRGAPSSNVDFFTKAFHACVTGQHPTAAECLNALLDPSIENDAAAFNRQFAFVRGPLDMLLLAYKSDIVGVLSHNDFSKVRLSDSFKHVKEAVDGLGLFNNILV